MTTLPPLALPGWIKAPYRLVNSRLYRTISDLSDQVSTLSEQVASLERELAAERAAAEEAALANESDQDIAAEGPVAEEVAASSAPVEEVANTDLVLPSIFLAAIPKSAGTYVYRTLQDGLSLKHIHLALGYFPKDMIVWEKIYHFSQGNCIDSKHLDPSDVNLWFLKYTKTRTVVHVRDLRQVILSWVHHNSAYEPDSPIYPDTPGYHIASPGADWFEMPFESKLDWMIDHHLPLFVKWTEDWLSARDAGDVEIMFTTYEDFNHDREKFFGRILDFYGIPRECFGDPDLAPSTDLNFRRGEAEEWREVFSEEQKKRACSIISDRLYREFSWPRD